MALRNEKIANTCGYCGNRSAIEKIKCDQCQLAHCNTICEKNDKRHKLACKLKLGKILDEFKASLDTRVFKLLNHDINEIYDRIDLDGEIARLGLRSEKITLEEAECLVIKLLTKFKDGSILENVNDLEKQYGPFKEFFSERAVFKEKYKTKLADRNGIPPKHNCI